MWIYCRLHVLSVCNAIVKVFFFRQGRLPTVLSNSSPNLLLNFVRRYLKLIEKRYKILVKTFLFEIGRKKEQSVGEDLFFGLHLKMTEKWNKTCKAYPNEFLDCITQRCFNDLETCPLLLFFFSDSFLDFVEKNTPKSGHVKKFLAVA